MGINKLREKVKEQQEKVGKKVCLLYWQCVFSMLSLPCQLNSTHPWCRCPTVQVLCIFVLSILMCFYWWRTIALQLHKVARTAGMRHSVWVENADRWVAGFMEKFEEGCHSMVAQSRHPCTNNSTSFSSFGSATIPLLVSLFVLFFGPYYFLRWWWCRSTQLVYALNCAQKSGIPFLQWPNIFDQMFHFVNSFDQL